MNRACREQMRQIICSIILCMSFLGLRAGFIQAKSIRFDFNNDNNVQYDPQKAEIYSGQLYLSPTGFWTNTGVLGSDTLPGKLFQETNKGGLFYSAQHAGAPIYATYKSTNYGDTWYYVADCFNNIIQRTNNVLYGGFWSGVKKSVDLGENWSDLFFHGYSRSFLIDSRNYFYITVMVTSTHSNYLYQSKNEGTNWNMIYKEGIGGSIYEIADDLFELNNGKLLSATKTGIYISSNFGTNWKLLSVTTNFNCHELVRIGSDIYAYGGSGIMLSQNESQTWQLISGEECRGLIRANNGIFYKTFNTNVWKSFDNGVTWNKLRDLKYNGQNYGLILDQALI